MIEKLKTLNLPKMTPHSLAYAVLILLILLELIFSTFHVRAANQNVLHRLDDINRQIVQISADNNRENFNASLSSINQEMKAIKSSVDETAKVTDVQKVSTQISSLTQAIEALKKIMSTNSNGKEYLDKSELPFSVNTIDVIAETPFVSVNYKHAAMPLEAGDSLGGWQLVSADYGSGKVEFKNDQSQYVDVVVQG